MFLLFLFAANSHRPLPNIRSKHPGMKDAVFDKLEKPNVLYKDKVFEILDVEQTKREQNRIPERAMIKTQFFDKLESARNQALLSSMNDKNLKSKFPSKTSDHRAKNKFFDKLHRLKSPETFGKVQVFDKLHESAPSFVPAVFDSKEHRASLDNVLNIEHSSGQSQTSELELPKFVKNQDENGKNGSQISENLETATHTDFPTSTKPVLPKLENKSKNFDNDSKNNHEISSVVSTTNDATQILNDNTNNSVPEKSSIKETSVTPTAQYLIKSDKLRRETTENERDYSPAMSPEPQSTAIMALYNQFNITVHWPLYIVYIIGLINILCCCEISFF